MSAQKVHPANPSTIQSRKLTVCVCVDWKSASEQDTHEVRAVMGFCALDGGLMEKMDTSKTHEMLAQVYICDASICRRCLTQVVGVVFLSLLGTVPECEACWHAHKLCQLPRQHLTACQLDVIAPRKGRCLQSKQG